MQTLTHADPLIVAGVTLRSRLFLGTGKYTSDESMLAAIEASGWTLSELDDMRNEAAAVVTNLSFIDESEWELDSLQDLRKEAESTAARLEDIEKAS